MLTEGEKNLLLTQVQTDVSLISFITVIAVFFTGSLLPQFNSYDISVKIPISFLIVSTFALLFSALILSNSSDKIVKGDSEKIKKYLMWGYAISEYMGVFLFVLSIPLVISIITTDFYLRTITFFSAILGIGFYQFMGFSLLENHFSKSSKLISFLIILFGIGLFLSQILAFHFTIVSILFLLFVLLITCLGPIERFQ